MTKLTVAVVKRGSLVDILRGVTDPNESTHAVYRGEWPARIEKDSVGVGYVENQVDSLPSILIIPGNNRREFFAWVNTYCPFVTPLSQWCRVVTKDEISTVEDLPVFPRYGDVASAWAGAIVGESLLHLGTLSRIADLTVAGLQSCSSFVAARGFGLWASEKYRDDAVAQYGKARVLLGAGGVADYQQLWTVLEGLSSPTSNLERNSSHYVRLAIQSCREIQKAGFVKEATMSILLHELGWSRRFVEFERSGAEERVALFDRAVESMKSSAKDAGSQAVSGFGCADLAEFTVSYFAARIGGGASSHILLLERLVDEYPALALWYGMASGLYRPGTWGAEFDRVGRIVLKELFFPLRLDEPPRCDIAFDELVAIVEPGADSQSLGFRGATRRGLNIEVALGVNGMVRVSGSSDDQDNIGVDHRAIQVAAAEMQAYLKAASESAYRLRQLYAGLLAEPRSTSVRNRRRASSQVRRGQGEKRDDQTQLRLSREQTER